MWAKDKRAGKEAGHREDVRNRMEGERRLGKVAAKQT